MTNTPELPGPLPWKSGGGRFDEWIEDANGAYINLDVALAYLNAAPAREAQSHATGHREGQERMRERAAGLLEQKGHPHIGHTEEMIFGTLHDLGVGYLRIADAIRALTPEDPDTERKG